MLSFKINSFKFLTRSPLYTILFTVTIIMLLFFTKTAEAQQYDVGDYVPKCTGIATYASTFRGLTANDRVYGLGNKIYARTYATDCDDATGTDATGCYYDQHLHTCSSNSVCIDSPDFYCVKPGSPPPCNSSNCSNCSLSVCLTIPGCSIFSSSSCGASTDTCRKNTSQGTCESKGCYWNPTNAYASGFICESVSSTTDDDDDAGDESGTKTCESVPGSDGATYTCQVGPNCTSGSKYTGGNSDCSGYSSSHICCRTAPVGAPPEDSGTTPPTTPTETCVYHGVSCGASGNADAVVKTGSSEGAPYKNGQFCGGTYHDIYECTNNSTGEKRLRYDRIPSADAACAPGGSWCAASTNPCQSRGGLMAGVPPVPLCGEDYYDSAKANKTQAQGNPYCGKEYKVNYHCSDNTWEAKTTGFAPGICNAEPWCNTTTSPSTGTGETCSGAPSAVGGNCPANKPICNRSGTQGDCVAQGSISQGQFCAKAQACQTGVCNDAVCSAPVTGGNPAAPTPQPLDPDIYCPTIDTDGRPNTCYYSSTCQTGYSLKPSSLAHQACSAHTGGLNPYCCHKDASSAPTPTPNAVLDPRCPALDTDNRPNSCADVNACPAGYSHKTSQYGDSDCTEFRGKPSWCCHQGGAN